MGLVTFSLIGLLSLVGTGYALRCYSCGSSSLLPNGCSDPFQKDGIVSDTCPGSCFKSTATALSTVVGSTSTVSTVRRGCLTIKQPDGCNPTGAGDASTNNCYCSTELCNGASHHQVVSTSSGILLGITALVLRA